MIPVLYAKNETAFLTNGLGRLSEAVSCIVTEEKNGEYELQMEYPITGTHFGDIAEDMLILSRHDDSDDTQPFRIYKITGDLGGRVMIFARHISYDLNRITALPYKVHGCAAAVAGLASNAVTVCPFNFTTDIEASGEFTLEAPASIRAALGSSSEASIMGTFGGEVEWDRFNVRLLFRRGADNGVSIRYGKNLSALEKSSEGGTYAAIVPYYMNNEGVASYAVDYVVSVGDYTDAPPVDITDRFPDYVPSPQEVRQAGLDWLTEQTPYVTPQSLTIAFEALWQTEEYKDYAPVQRVGLGDDVTVHYAALGVDDKLRVVKTVFDVLQERYTEVTLGEFRPSVSSVLQEVELRLQKEIDTARTIISQIANGTYTGGTFLSDDLIFSPHIYGGSIFIGPNGEGYHFCVDPNGNIETSGGMTAKGAYAVRLDDETMGAGTIVGYFGRAKGSDGISDTRGVALVGPNGLPDGLGSYSTYVIVTNAGVRMQAGLHSLWVAASGAAYDGDEIATIPRVYEIIDDMLNDDDNVNVGD